MALLMRPILRDHWAVARTARRLAERRGEGGGAALGGAMTPPLVFDPVSRVQLTAVLDLDAACGRRLAEMQARAGLDALVVDGLPDPVILIDGNAAVVRVNAAARALFGRAGVGAPLALLLRDPSVLAAADAVLGGAAGRSIQITLPGAVERDFEVRVGPLPQRDPSGAEALINLHDVSKLVRLERMRADFVANASHELRTPLSSVVGFVETLMGPARDDEEARERFLAIMLEQGRRMQRLVEDLLSLSRIEINEHSPPTDIVHLTPLVRGIADGLELKGRDKTMRIVCDLGDDLPPVFGEADQLAQVFQNLMDNAIKYGHPGTAVTVSGGVVAEGPAGMPPPLRGPSRAGSRRAPCLHIAVSDQGDGIAREHLPRLTERFYRVDQARSRQMGGTGLGLAIVKHVLARHRGVLVPDSVEGEGSTFHVYLPLAPEDAASRPAEG
jgi:two-component system phosphate regulon sensor histidine kinase PhoR